MLTFDALMIHKNEENTLYLNHILKNIHFSIGKRGEKEKIF